MVRIYGASDDLVEIEGSEYQENEIGCFDANVRIWFEDGTVIRVGYPKRDLAVWWVEIECAGSAEKKIKYCNDEEADIYSDIFEINSEIVMHEILLPLRNPDDKEPAEDAGPAEDDKVIQIEEKMPHKVSEVICVRCCRRWLAVRPEGTLLRDMECPGCGKNGGVIETGEEIDDQD